MTENEISNKVIGCAIVVHRALGPGLLESAYEECLAAEMKAQGIIYERQRPIPLIYRDIKLDCGYRLDFLVEDKVVIELKAIDVIPPVVYAQVLTYLRLLDKRLGLVINFHVEQLRMGIKRIVNNLNTFAINIFKREVAKNAEEKNSINSLNSFHIEHSFIVL